MSEQEYWRRIVSDLQAAGFGLVAIGAQIGLTERQVTNIKNGDRPKGWSAIHLYLFHVKNCPVMDDRVDGTQVPFFLSQKV